MVLAVIGYNDKYRYKNGELYNKTKYLEKIISSPIYTNAIYQVVTKPLPGTPPNKPVDPLAKLVQNIEI